MSLQLASPDKKDGLILPELAKAYRELLIRHAYHHADTEWVILDRYDEMFSKKEQRGKNTNGSTD